MIDYIRKTASGLLEIVTDNHKVTVDQALTGYLNHLAQQSLRSIDTILKQTRKILKCSQKVPIYINNGLVLIQYYPLRSPSTLLINYLSIAHITDERNDTCTLYFKSGATLVLNNLKRLIKQKELAKKLIDYLDLNMLK